MRARTGWLIFLGVLLVLFVFVLFLPASLINRYLPPGASTGTLTGTLWNGAADPLTVNGRQVGAVRWKVRPSELLHGRLGVDALLVNQDASVQGRASLGLGNSVRLSNVEGRWPIAALPMAALPPGWTGDINISMADLSLEDGAIANVLGHIDLRNLREPPPGAVAIGSYRVTFDEQSRQADKLVGRLQDLEGPMAVSGTITLGGDRSYVLDGLVAARNTAPPSMAERLRYLGSPDAQGRRPFSVAGTY
jgi:general secretion pathway protein N